MSIDTVSNAELSPETPQPFAELGLKPDEYQRIREILGIRLASTLTQQKVVVSLE